MTVALGTTGMFTPQQPTHDSNPGPSDQESHALCMSPPIKTYLIIYIINQFCLILVHTAGMLTPYSIISYQCHEHIIFINIKYKNMNFIYISICMQNINRKHKYKYYQLKIYILSTKNT